MELVYPNPMQMYLLMYTIHTKCDFSDPEEKTVLHPGGEVLAVCRGEELPLLQIQEMSPVREYLSRITYLTSHRLTNITACLQGGDEARERVVR